MTYNVIIKDVANIVYDKQRKIFLVKYVTEELTETSISKIIEIFNQLVKEPVILINDIRAINSFKKDLRDLIKKRLNTELLIENLLVTDNSMNKLIMSYLMNLSSIFGTQNTVKIFSSLEEALSKANSLSGLQQ